jgi:threonylcarbamoyladenosine tRNA methylthiotransferase MtaB
MVRGFYVQNFGCRATQSDGAALERQLAEHGLEPSPNPVSAEVVVLNTCTVTASADQDARAAIRRLHRLNPSARIIVTGCYAQRAPEEIAALPGVSQVIGNSHKHELARIAVDQLTADQLTPEDLSFRAERGTCSSRSPRNSVVPLARLVNPALASVSPPTTDDRRLTTASPIFVSDIFAHTDFISAPVFDAANERTRPNLKVQDGCDNRCSFCVIPFVRGHSRSLPLERAIEEVDILVAAGYRELVISGINLGRWGRDLIDRGDSALSLPTLIRTILARTRLEKLRISSVEPMDWTDELISLVAHSPRIAKHAHVPMQSGSDGVLRRMHRKYRPWHYREKVRQIHAAMPTAAIGADVMVGFPGETDAEFEDTRLMIEDLPFTYLHVFTYSPRPGTPAAQMDKQVSGKIAHERNRILRDLAAPKKLAFMRSFVGNTLEAITLKRYGADAPVGPNSDIGAGPRSFTEALTDNYLKLLLAGRHEPNRWLKVQVIGIEDGALLGTLAA